MTQGFLDSEVLNVPLSGADKERTGRLRGAYVRPFASRSDLAKASGPVATFFFVESR